MKTDYRTYPPRIAADLEVTEQRDGGRPAFIIGPGAAGRYILLGETEYKVLGLLTGSLQHGAVCDEFKARYGGTLPPVTLTKFLTKLDQAGILAGERGQGNAASDQLPGQQFYVRFTLFNPERLFARLVPPLRWVWTAEFVACTLLVMLFTLLFSLVHWAEVTSYSDHILGEHYVAVLAAGLLVISSHEFAHGLTCQAFGGRVTEVGVLLVFYFLPGLYCNVSGIHLIPRRGRRLWVIAAGIYWQLLVGTFALLAWFLLAPYTLPADLAFIFFLGSVLNIVFNANPLIKLDGYYFLSQWLRLPNLMDRSRAYWRGLVLRILYGKRDEAAARCGGRERAIYAAFGLLSFSYAVALAFFIVRYVGEYLINAFHLPGLLLTAGIALAFVRRPLKRLNSAAAQVIVRAIGTMAYGATARRNTHSQLEGTMATNDEATRKPAQPLSSDKGEERGTQNKGGAKQSVWRRRLVPLTILLSVVGALLMPWDASVGNYGTLIAIPEREAIIRAPESATLIALGAQPGEQVAGGTVVGRMGNLDLEEQLVQVQTDLARTRAEYDRLGGELRARAEAAARAELQLRQRRHDYDEINSEQRQIAERKRAEAGGGVRFITASAVPAPAPAQSHLPDQPAAQYPAAIAVLQADVDLRHARHDEADIQRDRARKLFAQGLVPRSELDAAEVRSSVLAIELAAARERLGAALIDHRRRHASAASEMNVAGSDVSAERMQVEKLNGELRAMRDLMSTLEERESLLRRKRAQFELVTLRAGTVFGEELPRMVGQYFQRGAEICRVADTRQLLLRLQVPEREIGDVRAGHPVRLKTRAFPDHVFRGFVTKIGGEGEQDQYNQVSYRVELTIENGGGLLRPGMTAFARIDFGRRMIARILLHKVKRALRPELWML